MCFAWLFRRRKKKNAAEQIKEEVVSQPEEVVTKAEEIKPVVEVKAPAVEAKPKVKETVRVDNGKVLVKVRYNRSYTAKIIQGDDKLKNYYTAIRNELESYGVHTRISWRYETFRLGRKLLARLAVRGKTLGLYLALDPNEYADTKYKINDVSAIAKNADVPLLYKIKNDRRCKYAKDLIFAVMWKNGVTAKEVPAEDYAAKYPYEKTEPLIRRGLIKLLKWKERSESAEEGLIEVSQERYEQLTAENISEVVENIAVSVAEAEERMADEEVEAFVNVSERYSDKTKKDIVNIDALGKYFKADETVTVKEIVKRVPSVNSKATYIKVLARGTLNKPLHIEADDFSPAAIKMIVLTGGTVTRTKQEN